jgi:hypothetical protein
MTRLGVYLEIGLLFTLPICVQAQSDRERHGLVGQVRRVRIEIATLEKKGADWIEGKRTPGSEIVYEPGGQAHVLRGTAPAGPDPAPGTAFRQLASEGAYANKITKAYDTDGDLIEEAFYAPDGSFEGNVTFVYDDAEKLIEENYRRADGSLRAQATYEFDGRARVTGEKKTLFNRDGSPEQKIGATYEYDALGNWVKRTRWIWNPSAQSEKTRVTVTYRSIDYF